MVLGDCGEGGTGAAPWCCLLHQAPGAGSGQPLGSREAAAGAARPLQGLALNAGLLCTPVTWPSLAILGLQASGPLHLPACLPSRRPWGATVVQQEGGRKAAWPAPSPGGAGTGQAGCLLLGGDMEPRLWVQFRPGSRALCQGQHMVRGLEGWP